MTNGKGKVINSVDKAVQILDVLSDFGRPLSLAELHQQLGWPKSTIHGLLSTMRANELIVQNSRGRYWLGLRLFEYGSRVSGAWDAAEVAKPHLKRACDALKMPVFLSVLDHGEAVTLAAQKCKDCPNIPLRVGERVSIHCTSQGKLFLAHLSQAEVRRLLNAEELKAHTTRTLTNPELFSAELSRIRKYGYAVENGEYRAGLHSISVPVYDEAGQIACAIGCISAKLTQEHIPETVKVLRQAAEKITQAIGGKTH